MVETDRRKERDPHRHQPSIHMQTRMNSRAAIMKRLENRIEPDLYMNSGYQRFWNATLSCSSPGRGLSSIRSTGAVSLGDWSFYDSSLHLFLVPARSLEAQTCATH
jgi:hypothetical protein